VLFSYFSNKVSKAHKYYYFQPQQKIFIKNNLEILILTSLRMTKVKLAHIKKPDGKIRH